MLTRRRLERPRRWPAWGVARPTHWPAPARQAPGARLHARQGSGAGIGFHLVPLGGRKWRKPPLTPYTCQDHRSRRDHNPGCVGRRGRQLRTPRTPPGATTGDTRALPRRTAAASHCGRLASAARDGLAAADQGPRRFLLRNRRRTASVLRRRRTGVPAGGRRLGPALGFISGVREPDPRPFGVDFVPHKGLTKAQE